MVIKINRGEKEKQRGVKMADGCYDLDGRCVICGDFHPCRCEANNDRVESSSRNTKNIDDEDFYAPTELFEDE